VVDVTIPSVRLTGILQQPRSDSLVRNNLYLMGQLFRGSGVNAARESGWDS
jgi:hypothetical protein